MNTLLEIIVLIIESLATIYLLFVLLRFLLQLTRADFYNPLSQAVVRVTNPLLIPLRKIIPGIFGIDLASVVLAIIVQALTGELIYLVLTLGKLLNPIPLIAWGLIGSLMVITYIYLGCILVVVVSSFIAPFSSQPFIVLARQLVEPIMHPIQRVIPSFGGLDFSVFFIGIGIIIIQKILTAIAISLGAIPRLVIGF